MKKYIFILMSAAIANSAFAQALTKNGQITNTTANYISRNGGVGTSGVNKNGAIVNINHNALNLDGVNDNVLVPSASSLNLNSTITMEAWIYATKNSGIQNVVSKSNSSNNNGYIFPRTDNGWTSFCIYITLNGGWVVVSSPYPSLNAWHHVAATYDGSNVKLYLDGTLVKTQAATGAIAVNPNSLCIGSQPGYGEYFGGNVDEIRIWNTVRTQTEIQNAMNSELAGNEVGLVAYYNFNQGTAAGTNTGINSLTDKTANANNGTLNSFALTGASSNWVTGRP
jgi:Concanavalin A-like lectin/glucanases superfamily